MSKRLIILASVCILFLGLYGVVGFRNNISLAFQGSQSPEEAARQELPKVLHTVFNLGCEKYGFSDENELKAVSLGSPYEVYILSPQALQKYRYNERVADLIMPEQQWEFPVLVNGEARGLLTVALQDSQWQVVGFGDLTLSQKLMDLQAGLSNTEAAPNTLPPVKLLKVYQIYDSV